MTKENLAAGRLNNILLNLFYLAAAKTYDETSDSQSAYILLKDCEKIFYNHPDSYYHYILLARFAYENGNLDEAKAYTNKAKERMGETFEVLLNLAFFAIIDFNIDEVTKWYKRLLKKAVPTDFNAADVIDFLERQKTRLCDHIVLLDFAIGLLNSLFLDADNGRIMLSEFICSNAEVSNYTSLINFAKEVINSSNNYQRKTTLSSIGKKGRKKKKKSKAEKLMIQ